MSEDSRPKLISIQGNGPTLRKKIARSFKTKFPNANPRFIAAISALVVAFSGLAVFDYINTPTPLDEQLPLQAEDLGSGVKIRSASITFDGEDGKDLIKRRVGFLSTPNGFCPMTFELAYQPNNGLTANIIDISTCEDLVPEKLPKIPKAIVGETFTYEGSAIDNNVCNTPVALDTLKSQAARNIKGFKDVVSLDVEPFRDCADNTSVIRPAMTLLKNGEQCEMWAKFDSAGISLFRKFECPGLS